MAQWACTVCECLADSCSYHSTFGIFSHTGDSRACPIPSILDIDGGMPRNRDSEDFSTLLLQTTLLPLNSTWPWHMLRSRPINEARRRTYNLHKVSMVVLDLRALHAHHLPETSPSVSQRQLDFSPNSGSSWNTAKIESAIWEDLYKLQSHHSNLDKRLTEVETELAHNLQIVRGI